MGELFRKRGGDEKQYGDLTPLPNFSKEKPLFNPEAEHILADELRGFILGKRSTGRYMDIEYLPHLAYLSAFLKQSAEKGSGLRPDFEKTPFEKKLPALFKALGFKTLCDVGCSGYCDVLKFLSPMLRPEGIGLYGLDRHEPNPHELESIPRHGIHFVQGDGMVLPDLIQKRADFEEVKHAGGFDVILLNGVTSPGAFERGLTAFDEEVRNARQLTQACVNSLSLNPHAFVLLTPKNTVLTLDRKEVESFSRVLHWRDAAAEEIKASENTKEWLSQRGWAAKVAILGRK